MIFVTLGGIYCLYALNSLTTGKATGAQPYIGLFLEFGNKELEIDCVVSSSDFFSGACFGRGSIDNASIDVRPNHASSSILKKKFVPLKPSVLNQMKSTSLNDVAVALKETNDVIFLETDPTKTTDNLRPETSIDEVKDTYWTANW